MALLVVEDDGRGGATARGNGLTGIAERLVALGGRSVVRSPADGGTRVELRVPIDAAFASSTTPRSADQLAA